MARTVQQQRTLSNLFEVGRPCKIENEHGEAVVVWLQKLDPVDHDSALRKAKAARAKARAVHRDPESDEMYIARDALDGATQEQLVNVITAKQENELRDSIRAQLTLGEDSEWAKDDYLMGLFDALNNSDWETDPDDEDAKHVLAELKRFNNQITEKVTDAIKELRGQFEDRDVDSLREQALIALVESRCDEAWLNMFTAAEIWLAVRKPCDQCVVEVEPDFTGDHHVELHESYYFSDIDQVLRLRPEARGPLEAAYSELHLGLEGKGLPGTGSSSDSSEPSGEPEETPEPSGLAAATA